MCLHLTKGQNKATGDLHIGEDGVYSKEGKTCRLKWVSPSWM